MVSEIVTALANDPEKFCKERGLGAPIDLCHISQLLDVDVACGLTNDLEFDDLAYSGHVRKTEDGRGSIWINPFESDRRQRFTLAHELGHFVLHLYGKSQSEFKDNDSTLRRGGSWNADEYEANNFAAKLLMPQHLILEHGQKLVNQYRGANDERRIDVGEFVSAMADVFNVSKPAMTYRLKNLRLIP